ncbi:3'-5' exonuclease [Algoriphagus litoralis]|uniref:3'-5' exonuclease n=1 Tax=Algoriphagus litoralis TaxID=2202829 RepID=UPI000DB93D45|nr:3'-5' exonuclease [Algoriphagus litoralis]
MSWWEFWKPKKERLDFVRDFLAGNETPIPGIRSISQLKFTVLDTETTGLDPAKDSILSFGAVKVESMKIQVPTAVEWYPKSGIIPGKAAQIHGLIDIIDQISEEEFVKLLLPYLGDSVLVGHHIGFDLEMIGKIVRPFGIAQMPNPVIDTLNFAVRLEHGPQADLSRIPMGAYSLDELCIRFGIELEDRHTAAGDAFLTAQLFLKLLRLAEKKGIRTYKELLR